MPKPSAGSILGTIGFSVPDLDGAIKKLQAEGVKMVMPPMVMQGIRSAQVGVSLVHHDQHHAGSEEARTSITSRW